MAIAAANLNDLVVDVLDTRWFVDSDLTAEYSIAETQLTLAIISKSVQLSSLCDDSGVQIAAFDARNWVRGVELEQLRSKELRGNTGADSTLALLVTAPCEYLVLIRVHYSVIRATCNLSYRHTLL